MHHLICGLLIFAVGPSNNWGESPQDSQTSKLRENPGPILILGRWGYEIYIFLQKNS